ncbi:Adenosine deaminase CECR1-A [Mycena venus]|uniref:Adenosine deaminase n=1 Tax=Mycena venus TaxID=2733690 RepID=A0A8H6YLC9_9AGAR|nr:Adenosine deaminase CECR1-A [Mycena venus]
MFPTYEHYKQERAALIDRDRSLRADYAQVFSETELKADRIVRSIRTAEAASIWGAKHPEIAHPFPGMEFLTGRSIIVKTKLFEILSKMPKGALLHVHLDATVNAKTLLGLALEEPAMHVRVPQRLTRDNIASVLMEFKALPRGMVTDSESYMYGLTGAGYAPNTWVPLRAARETFDVNLGGPEGFDLWVVGVLSIDPSEAYGTHNTVDKIWEKFASIFQVSGGLIYFAPVWRKYLYEFLRSSVEDGISYIEARAMFFMEYMVGEDGMQNVPHREWLLMFDEVQNALKEELKQQARESEFIGARIIYTTLRFITTEELDWYCEDCISLKKEFPHLIAGFDLAGPENILLPLIDYAEGLLRFRERQREEGVDIPLILHAGETCGDGTHADMNLYDAVLLGSQRIGHGFSLVKHPKLMEACREKGILIEVCPISNEVLRLTSAMPMHPLPILMNNGIPIAISSDDPGVFGNVGLTFDMYQVLVSSEVTGLATLRELARDSLKYSTLGPKDKEEALDSWQRHWEIFVEWVADLSS